MDLVHTIVMYAIMHVCSHRFFLEREELDNLHKSKLHRYYPIGFAVEMVFERSSDLSGTYSVIENRPIGSALLSRLSVCRYG